MSLFEFNLKPLPEVLPWEREEKNFGERNKSVRQDENAA
jgi:hypothetical protein